jgi:hypothetical protein
VGDAVTTIHDVQAGDNLQVDDGFTCMQAEDVRKVEADHDGKLFVRCTDGRHFLDGQIDGETLVGLQKISRNVATRMGGTEWYRP